MPQGHAHSARPVCLLRHVCVSIFLAFDHTSDADEDSKDVVHPCDDTCLASSWSLFICMNTWINARIWAATGSASGRGSEHERGPDEDVESPEDTTSEPGEDGWLEGSAITGNELTMCGMG